VREGGPIASLTIRKPKGGDLRGTKLTELMAADVDAVAKSSRASPPRHRRARVLRPRGRRLAEVVGTVVGFSEQGPARSDGGDDGLTVESLIADIAAVFHWPLSDLPRWTGRPARLAPPRRRRVEPHEPNGVAPWPAIACP
jgi:hypothetical protein